MKSSTIHARVLATVLLLLYYPWNRDPFILPKMFVAACILFSWLTSTVSTPVLRPRVIPAMWLFLAATCFSCAFTQDVPHSAMGLLDFPALGILQIGIYSMCFLLGASSCLCELHFTIVVAGTVMAAATPFTHEMFAGVMRSGSTQGFPISLAAMLAVCFPVILMRKWLTPALLPFFLSAAYFSHSRAAWLGIIVGLGVHLASRD